jgi:hypothetical protein
MKSSRIFSPLRQRLYFRRGWSFLVLRAATSLFLSRLDGDPGLGAGLHRHGQVPYEVNGDRGRNGDESCQNKRDNGLSLIRLCEIFLYDWAYRTPPHTPIPATSGSSCVNVQLFGHLGHLGPCLQCSIDV